MAGPNPKPRLRYPGFQGINVDALNINEIDLKAIPVVILQDLSGVAPVSGQPSTPGQSPPQPSVPVGDRGYLQVTCGWQDVATLTPVSSNKWFKYYVPQGWLVKLKDLIVAAGEPIAGANANIPVFVVVIALVALDNAIAAAAQVPYAWSDWHNPTLFTPSGAYYVHYLTVGQQLEANDALAWELGYSTNGGTPYTHGWPMVLPDMWLQPTGGIGIYYPGATNAGSYWYKAFLDALYFGS